MDFVKKATLATYLSNERGEYELREESVRIVKIPKKTYQRVVEDVRQNGMAVGQAGEGVSTERGDEFQALYNGAVITIVNPQGQYDLARGIEIEAEDEGGLEKAVRLLNLPQN